MSDFNLAGRTALVTGGTSGIGLELVRGLFDKGARRVFVVSRTASRSTWGDYRDRVELIDADLCCEAEIMRLTDRLNAEASDLSLVINNAGMQVLSDFGAPGALELLPALRTEIAINFTSVVGLSVGLLPLLARQPSAVLVNVTSGLALAPKQSSPVYCATKAGVRSFTRALRYQCDRAFPTVTVIEALPPLVDTPMTTGRGRGKISAAACAGEIISGIERRHHEIYVGKSKLLRGVMRISPALGHRIMRNG